jgi:hypothetical protein
VSAVERTVRVGLMSYIDSDGAHRSALAGAVVHIHPDTVERFDRLNRLLGDPAPEPVEVKVKRRVTRTPKSDVPEG